MQPSPGRRLIRLIIIFLILAVVVAGGLRLYNSRPRKVAVSFTQQNIMTIELYKGDELDEHGEAHEPTGDALATINTDQELKLAPGTYIAVSKDVGDYEEIKQSFEVRSEGAELTFDPKLKPSALEDMRAQEQAAITNALTSKFGQSNVAFTVVNTSLYKLGEWAGVTLTVPTMKDYFHVVLKKDGNWAVITEPAIILSSPQYPDIPRDILVEINKEQFEGIEARD